MDQRIDRNRDRLREVHQSDLTEGRINQDFLDWLQTKGMSWLLVLLVALCVYFAIVRWKSHQTGYQTEAWTELANATLPSSYEDVAEKYADVGSVAHLARLRAADQLLTATQIGKEVGAADPATAKDLTEQDRTDYLDRADRLYTKVLESDDKSVDKALLMVTALTGRAAVAESKGQADQARQFYTQAAERAGDAYPQLAQQARERADSVTAHAQPVVLLSQAELNAVMAKHKPPQLDPVSMEPWARALLLPEE